MIRLAPEAVRELAEAAAWYETRREGLGREFAADVERALPELAKNPARFLRLLDPPEELVVRRALLPRFPYAIVFMEMTNQIRVLAIAHLRRQPGYWLGRVRS